MKKTVCHLQLEFPKGTNKNKIQTDQAVYSASTGFIIRSFRHRHLRDLGPTSFNVSHVPANSNFVSNAELSTAYNNATNVAAELGFKGSKLAELKADLNVAYSEFTKYSNMISASHQTITHKASIRGAGMFNGRTQYEGEIEIEEEEIPQAMRDQAALESYFQTLINDFAAKNPADDGAGPVVTPGQKEIPKLIQSANGDIFTINNYDQLVRIYWEGQSKAEVVSDNWALIRSSLCYDAPNNTFFALTEEDTHILVAQKINGKWESGIIPTWGGKLIPETLHAYQGQQFGVFGVNENGHLTWTWKDDQYGAQIPDGQKYSFAVINEAKEIA